MFREQMLDSTLGNTWQVLCEAYDVMTEMPDIEAVFKGADLSRPYQAAEIVIFNMLEEITQNIGRFSPWYAMPARAFGLIRVQNAASKRSTWMLAPEASQRWRHLSEPLAEAIVSNSAVMQAEQYLDQLSKKVPPVDDTCVVSACECEPRRSVLVHRSVMENGAITCGVCGSDFHPVD